jgi:hypothetical protein
MWADCGSADVIGPHRYLQVRIMMGSLTKIVLLMGAVAFGGLLILPWLAPWSLFWNPSDSPFSGLTGTGRFAEVWMGLLLCARR